MKTWHKQILLVLAAVLLTAALYFFPQKVHQGERAASQSNLAYSFEGLLSQAKGQLKRQELSPIQDIEKAWKLDTANTKMLDSLGRSWDRAQFPVISAYYFEMIAERKNGEMDWLNAAYRYFDAYKFSGDSLLRRMMVDKAIDSYKKVLDINPANLNAKTDLGICYAEASSNPMQGIMLLREVVEENPEHENAQFNLGILSVKSGQLEKAVERFEKVKKINPGRVEALYLLGQMYLQLGDNKKALDNLRAVKGHTNDPQILAEVNSLINKVNNQ